jgi:ABC-type branched-subunit amino acid transport system ATPase component
LAAEPPPALLAEGLSKRYGGRRALADATLSLRAGRIGGIIGPNGAGKSTLVGVMAGTVRPDAGRIRLAGQDIAALSQRARARRGLARSFQTPHIFASLTLRQHITLCAPDGGWGLEAARLLGLDGALDRACGTFSHGMRRLVEICHLAAARPAVLLLDEPAAGLTAFEMGQLGQALRWLRERCAVGVVEHNMGFLLKLVDEVTVLEAGRVIAHGTPAAITEDEAVRRAYLGAGHVGD